MKNYKYTAVNINKEKFSGIFIAKDEKDLAAQLAKQNLYLVSCTPYSDKTPSAFFTMGTGKVNMGDLTTFCRQFSIMLNSGITVLQCLECLKDQAFSSYFKSLLQKIYEDVKGGIVLSEAIDKHKKVFPDFFRSMIYVGEVSGKLDTVFSSLADYYENDAAIKRKTKSALSYPLMLGGMTIGIVVLMLLFVIPTFRDALSSLNVELTGLTKAVYSVSDFLIANWLYALAIIVVIACGAFLFGRTKTGKLFFDKMKLTLPLIKKVQIDLISSRFARAFSLMLNSGMNFAEALDAVVVILGNKDMERRFAEAAEDVKHGKSLTESFTERKLFPQVMLQMISVGERTASLDDILARSCNFFDEQVKTSLNSVTSKIEPIMLIIMGVIIAVLFVAVYSPMISIMSGLI